MKRCTSLGIITIFLGISCVFSTVIVDEPTIPDLVADIYKKAKSLRNEFPELSQMDPCSKLKIYEERGRLGEAHSIKGTKAWDLQRERLRLMCNFETMWIKIKVIAQFPTTTDTEYIAALFKTLSAWEVSWRALQTQL